MAGQRSAGILMFRRADTSFEVLLGHMGGPFWARKDAGAWSVPKGEYAPDEPPQAAARREFTEELGLPVPDGALTELGSFRQSGGKTVIIWALEGDLDPAAIVPGTFELEWPRGSGHIREYPEVDRAEWFDVQTAHGKIISGQRAALGALAELLGDAP